MRTAKTILKVQLKALTHRDNGGVFGDPPSPVLTFRAGSEDSRGMASIPKEFQDVTAVTKANVYFDGKVVSHTLLLPDGSKKTLGLIYPGQFHFGTDKSERMEIVAGGCLVKLDGQSQIQTYSSGQDFEVPAKSGFNIEVKQGICEYICSFLG
jgi:purine/pyrimidine-nucleoside phosphorylase